MKVIAAILYKTVNNDNDKEKTYMMVEVWAKVHNNENPQRGKCSALAGVC